MASAQFSGTINVTAAKSKTATFIAAAETFDAPVAPGTIVGHVEVDPPGWKGTLTVNQPFVVPQNTNNIAVGTVQLAEGEYTVSGSADP